METGGGMDGVGQVAGYMDGAKGGCKWRDVE